MILHQDERAYRLVWSKGRVIAAISPAPADSIGRVALTAGLVSSTQLGEMLRRLSEAGAPEQASDPSRQLEVLAEVARLSDDQIAQIKRRALLQRAVRPFALERASFVLDNEASVKRDPSLPTLSARWLIRQGLRIHYSEERLRAEMASLAGMRFRIIASARSQLDDFGFGEVERRWITSAIGRPEGQDIAAIAAECPDLSRTQLLVMVYTLVATDVLEVAGRSPPAQANQRPSNPASARAGSRATAPLHTPKVGPPADRAAAATPSPSQAAAAAANPSRAGAARTVPLPPPAPAAQSRPASSRSPGRPTELLHSSRASDGGSGPTASPARDRAAAGNAREPAAPPPRSGTRATIPMPSKAANQAQPEGARTVQFSRGRRRTTLHPISASDLRRLVGTKAGEIDRGSDHFALLGVSHDATDDVIRKAYFDLASKLHPDRIRAIGVDDLTRTSQRVCAAINVAFGIIGNASKRKQYRKLLASGGAEGKAEREREVESKAMQALSAEEHFQRGEWALRRKNWSEAHQQFERAVELNPEEAEHHALLAWTLWCINEDKKEIRATVTEHLQRALQLRPTNLAALYYRGRIAVMDGKIESALHYFRKVLALDRSYQDTDLQVRLLERRRDSNSERSSNGLFSSLLKKPRK